jgi:hypothetical protein
MSRVMKANWIKPSIGEALIISNVDADDTTFDSDVGSWNVSRATRDCTAGKHRPYVLDIKATLANNDSVTVHKAKAKAFAKRAVLAKLPPAVTGARQAWRAEVRGLRDRGGGYGTISHLLQRPPHRALVRESELG